MIASLPMYVRPELAAAHDRYWRSIRAGLERAGIASPQHLSQDADIVGTWTDPGLVLGQTCGMPYRNDLHGTVNLVGTPDYGLDGCDPGFYRSVFVVRRGDRSVEVDEYASATFAFNDENSQSGYCGPYHHVAARGFWFGRRVRTGSHLASAMAVADGTADIAGIDAVTWRLLKRYEPIAKSLRAIDVTEQQPGLPYICGLRTSAPVVFDAVTAAIATLADRDRRALGLKGLVAIPAEAYLRAENPPPEVTSAL